MATFFLGSDCGSLTLGSPLRNPQCLGCKDKTHPNTVTSFLPNSDLLDDSNVWEKSLDRAALCLCSSGTIPWRVGVPGMVGSCSPARVGLGSEALSRAENTLQLITHMGQLISI